MIYFLIPAYNEEKNITPLLKRLHQRMITEQNGIYHMLVVNDGSTDQTSRRVQSLVPEMSLEEYCYFPNKGVGEVFRVGFQEILKKCHRDDIIVTIEADNTSDFSILRKLIDKIHEGNDVVLASCYAKEGDVVGTTLFRKFLSKSANLLLRIFFPFKGIHTYSSFYRVYRAETLMHLKKMYQHKFIEQQGFECQVELLVKLLRLPNIKISEVPMVLDGSKRKGKSKMKILKTIQGFLKVIMKEGIIYHLKALQSNP